MDLRRKLELQERLAAQFALGTLRGRARQRFQRWMAEEAAIARAAQRWELRLAPLASGVAPVVPPARVWRSIEFRLGAPAVRRPLWDRIAFWRNLGLIASGMAAGLAFAIAVLSQSPAPAPAPVVVRVPASEVAPTYLAVLSDATTLQPAIVVSAGRNSRELWVKTLEPSIHVEGRSLELWGLPPGGAPKSLGVLPRSEKMAAMPLARQADEALADFPRLAVSLEPPGGSPRAVPTGPVLYTGVSVKYW